MKTFFLSLALLLPAATFGQSYNMDWFKIAGGGGTSTGGLYQVRGTVGQPDASGPMTSGPMIGAGYSLTGGFWSIYAMQTPGAPWLTITCIGNRAIVSWPDTATGWTLQTNNNLTTGIWGNYAGVVANNSATNPPPAGNLFFRLKQ